MTKEQLPQPEQNPRQQTYELLKLLERLPLREGESAYEFMESEKEERLEGYSEFNAQREELREHRQKGEFRNVYLKKFSSLMENAKTTSACKEFLTWELERAYDQGLSSEIAEDDVLSRENLTIHKKLPKSLCYILIDYTKNPHSGGIFSQSTVEDLELKIYNGELANYDLLKMYMELPYMVAQNSDKERTPEEIKEYANRAFLSISHVITEVYNLTARGDSIEEIRTNHEILFANWRQQIEWSYSFTAHTEFSDDPKFLSSPNSEWTSLDGK